MRTVEVSGWDARALSSWSGQSPPCEQIGALLVRLDEPGERVGSAIDEEVMEGWLEVSEAAIAFAAEVGLADADVEAGVDVLGDRLLRLRLPTSGGRRAR